MIVKVDVIMTLACDTCKHEQTVQFPRQVNERKAAYSLLKREHGWDIRKDFTIRCPKCATEVYHGGPIN